jgi:hypothetical protein
MGGMKRIFSFNSKTSETYSGSHLEPTEENKTTEEKLKMQGFEISKAFVMKKPHVYIDNEHKKWATAKDDRAEPHIYDFSEILDCEIWENSFKTCNSLKVFIVVDDAENPLIYVNLINFPTAKNSFQYKKDIGYAQDIASTFIYMKNQPRNNTSFTNISIPFEIKQLADLEGQGILTQEEFYKKKTELLAKM